MCLCETFVHLPFSQSRNRVVDSSSIQEPAFWQSNLFHTMDPALSDIIKLNVGGRHFQTTRATLCAESGSMLAELFNPESPFASPPHDENGFVFLDRNPSYFEHILNYLRMNCKVLPEPPTERAVLAALAIEADYFGLTCLIRQVNTLLGNQKRAERAAKQPTRVQSDSVCQSRLGIGAAITGSSLAALIDGLGESSELVAKISYSSSMRAGSCRSNTYINSVCSR